MRHVDDHHGVHAPTQQPQYSAYNAAAHCAGSKWHCV
jgi:hypothetical protein